MAISAPSSGHACGVRHIHRCERCYRTSECCRPECRHLVTAWCAGGCGSTHNEIQEARIIGRWRTLRAPGRGGPNWWTPRAA
jgi:hypothetical protein